MQSCSNSAMLFLFTIALLQSLNSEAYNVDDKFPIRFTQPSTGSYFGYTVALLSNNLGKWVIVGAPRANSTYGGRQSIVEPGDVFKCNIHSSSRPPCSSLELGNASSAKSSSVIREDNGWLGVSLDISDDGTQLVACGHLVKNANYNPTGLCHATFTNVNDHTRSHKTLKASFEFAQNTSLFIFSTREEIAMSSFENNAARVSWQTYPYDSFSGYALTSGHFFSRENVQMVVGAPKDIYTGKVYIQEDGNQTSAISLSGSQIGEYFGASLCAVDLDKDGWDDLIVGAPLHTNDYDEGKIYVYKNLKNKNMDLQEEITGSKISARFGSSIASIGDIDQDGFQDIAIGAPYENGGKGAVYIYHGSPNGLNLKCQQIIMAKGNTRGFGIAIAGGLDTDNNGSPDIAIGAYGSDEVFIYRTRPTVTIVAEMSASKHIIDADEAGCIGGKNSCFNLTICFQTRHATKIYRTLAVDTLMLDGEPPSSRVNIPVDKTSKKNIQLISTSPNCETINVFVPKIPKDYFTPIKFKLSFKLVEEEKTAFCSWCPVLNPSTITQIEHEVRFKTKCNGRCNADLKVEAWIPELKNTSLIIGSTNQLSLKVKVLNLGDAAYITNLTVKTPTWITFDSIPPNCYRKTPLYCDVANILETSESSTLDFALNIENIPLVEVGNIDITCTASSQSEEQNVKDNTVLMKVPIKSETNIFVLGSTGKEQIFYDRYNVSITKISTVNFSHEFEIGNTGPTSMRAPIQFLFLAPDHAGENLILEIALNGSVPKFRRICDTAFTFTDSQELNSQDDVHISKVPANVAVLTCSSTARCRPSLCTINSSLPKDENIKLSFTIMVHSTALVEFMSDKDAVVIVTKLQIYRNQSEGITHQSAKVMTEIKPGGVPLSKPVDTWIIVGSVAGGLVVLALVVLAFWKFGFFKRPQKDAMKRLTRNVENLIEDDALNIET